MLSFLDGFASGIGYTFVLMSVSLVREILGFGSFFGISFIPETFTRWTLMVMPPSAFFILALIMWVFNNARLKRQREGVEKK